MAETPPPAGGNLLTRRYGPAPGYVYLAGATVAAYLIVRHRGSSSASSTGTTAAADPNAATDGTGDPAQNGAGFGETQPYDMSGQVYTDLAGAQATIQRKDSQLDHVRARLKTSQATDKRLRHRIGNLVPNTRIITVRKGESWKDLAHRYNTTVTELERLNPHVRGKPNAGDKIKVPEQKQAAAK